MNDGSRDRGQAPTPDRLRNRLWPADAAVPTRAVAGTRKVAVEKIDTLERARAALRTARDQAREAPKLDAEAQRVAHAEGKPLPGPTAQAKREAADLAHRSMQLAARDAERTVREHQGAIEADKGELIERQRPEAERELQDLRKSIDQLEARFTASRAANGTLAILYHYGDRKDFTPLRLQLTAQGPSGVARHRDVVGHLGGLLPALRELAAQSEAQAPQPPSAEAEAVQESRRAWASMARGGLYVGGDAA